MKEFSFQGALAGRKVWLECVRVFFLSRLRCGPKLGNWLV